MSKIKKQNEQSARQRWLRSKVAVAAYAYEFKAHSIMSDGDFDRYCKEIDPSISTIDFWHGRLGLVDRYLKLDKFFKEIFCPDTGMWIHEHPELHLVKFKYEQLYLKT